MNNDLISRSDLKKVFDNLGYLTVKIERIIDNAPTVEIPENEVNCVLTMFGKCSYNETGCSDCEIKDKIRKALNERPQGEWVKVIDYSDEYEKRWHYECSECKNAPYYCGEIYKLHFCPNCGAEMRGKKNDDLL